MCTTIQDYAYCSMHEQWLNPTILLAFTSAFRQKKRHIMHHVKFATIHQSFMSTVLYHILQVVGGEKVLQMDKKLVFRRLQSF